MIYEDIIQLTLPDEPAEGPDGIKVPTVGKWTHLCTCTEEIRDCLASHADRVKEYLIDCSNVITNGCHNS